jgi:hypothetical protein
MEAWPKVATEGEVKAIVKPKETLAFGDSETKALRSVAGIDMYRSWIGLLCK